METALQSSVYVSSPEFAGWLMKRGFRWRKLWKKRWVALHGAEIVYMDKEPTMENSLTMLITKAQISTATVIESEDVEGDPNGFAIHVNDGQQPVWYLRAENEKEKDKWLMRLEHVHAIVKWLEEFEKVRVLGVGGTGIVYELLHKINGKRFAMKEMEIKNKIQMQMAVSEAEMLKDIMENVSHPNIMHIERVFQVGSKFYLVFPLCLGGELYEHIIRRGHFTEHDAALLIRDLISGLHALHQHDILHLDIKPENILFDSTADDAKIKITDFGLSKLLSKYDRNRHNKTIFTMELMLEKLKYFQETGEISKDSLRGTVGYMSPELILTGHYSKATDVFAAGVVLYILLCGRPPFPSKSNREVLEKTARGIFSMSGVEWDLISPEAKDLVKRMLCVNPLERITTEEVLRHAWLQHLDDVDDGVVDIVAVKESVDDATKVGSKDENHLSKIRITTNLSTVRSGMHLAGAIKQLSGHVKQQRSEKLASNLSRLVTSVLHNSSSSAATANGNKVVGGGGVIGGYSSSSLTDRYLAASSKNNLDNNNKTAEANTAATTTLPPSSSELEMLVLDADFRAALTGALLNLEEINEGLLTIEQFAAIIAQTLGFNTASLTALLIGRMADRNGDGYVTADDIFALQAMTLQRSEPLVRNIFRVYTESIWYPGRQFNLMNARQSLHHHHHRKSTTTTASSASPNSSSDADMNNRLPNNSTITTTAATDHYNNNSTSNTTGNFNNNTSGYSFGTPLKITTNSEIVDVVEPPKYITAKHVAAVFERLGYDPDKAHVVFSLLCEALVRSDHNSVSNNSSNVDYSTDRGNSQKRKVGQQQQTNNNSNNNQSQLSSLCENEGDNYQSISGNSSRHDSGTKNSDTAAGVANKLFSSSGSGSGDDDDENNGKQLQQRLKALLTTAAATSVSEQDEMRSELARNNNNNNASIVNNNINNIRADKNTSNSKHNKNHHHKQQQKYYTSSLAASTKAVVSPASLHQPVVPLYARRPKDLSSNSTVVSTNSSYYTFTSTTSPAATQYKMDVTDFVRAVEIDDVLVQAFLRRARFKMMTLMQNARDLYNTQLAADILAMKSKEETAECCLYKSSSEKEELTSKGDDLYNDASSSSSSSEDISVTSTPTSDKIRNKSRSNRSSREILPSFANTDCGGDSANSTSNKQSVTVLYRSEIELASAMILDGFRAAFQHFKCATSNSHSSNSNNDNTSSGSHLSQNHNYRNSTSTTSSSFPIASVVGRAAMGLANMVSESIMIGATGTNTTSSSPSANISSLDINNKKGSSCSQNNNNNANSSGRKNINNRTTS